MMSKPCPLRPELDGLLQKAKKAWEEMSPDQKRELHRAQRISWVYGNLALSNPDITREMVEEAAKDWP